MPSTWRWRRLEGFCGVINTMADKQQWLCVLLRKSSTSCAIHNFQPNVYTRPVHYYTSSPDGTNTLLHLGGRLKRICVVLDFRFYVTRAKVSSRVWIGFSPFSRYSEFLVFTLKTSKHALCGNDLNVQPSKMTMIQMSHADKIIINGNLHY